MNLLERLFKREAGAAVDQEPEATGSRLAELQARRAEVSRRVRSGEATEAEYIEESELEALVVGASRAHDAAQSRANKKALAARVAEFDARVHANMTTVGGLVAQLLFALQDTEALVAEACDGVGMSRQLEDIFGVPGEFARDVVRAILDAAPGAQWDFDVCEGGQPKRPEKALPRVMVLPPDRIASRYV